MQSNRSCRYESVFANASYQFCGHVDEYLIAHTHHLGLFYTETRFGQKRHSLRIYEDGDLLDRELHIFLEYAVASAVAQPFENDFKELLLK